MFSLKHFLLGAGLALIPVSFYVYPKLNSSPASTLAVIASKQENAQYESRMALLRVEYEPLPTATPSPIHVPPKPIKKQVVQTTKMNVKLQKSSIPAISGPADVKILIDRYSEQYGVSKEMMTHIAKCESGFKASAVSGPYAGIYQFVGSTWAANRKAMGLDPNPNLRYNAEEAVKTAAFKMSRDGYGAWPACSRKAAALLASM